MCGERKSATAEHNKTDVNYKLLKMTKELIFFRLYLNNGICSIVFD